MKRALLPALALVLLGGCSRDGGPPAEAYRHAGDRLLVRMGGLFGQPCRRWVGSSRQRSSQFVGNARCFNFGPSRRMSGVWLYGREGSTFLPGLIEPPATWDLALTDIALDPVDSRLASLAGAAPLGEWGSLTQEPPLTRAFRIEFDGREMLGVRRWFGIDTDRLVIAEHVAALHEVPAPRRIRQCYLGRCEPASRD